MVALLPLFQCIVHPAAGGRRSSESKFPFVCDSPLALRDQLILWCLLTTLRRSAHLTRRTTQHFIKK